MSLRELIDQIPRVLEARGDLGVVIERVTGDSRRVQPGDCFCAARGLTTDGHRFIPEALRRGARALIVEEEVGLQPVPVVRVGDSRRALGAAAQALAGFPARDLLLVGITGTNGKTTTSYLVEAILHQRYAATAVVGTLGAVALGHLRMQGLTTPEATDLAGLLREFRDDGVRAVSMEVSSHAIAQGRIEGMEFDVGVFTNLTQDHLDFHGTFESYREAKLSFFRALGTGSKKATAVVNADDPAGPVFAGTAMVPVLTFSPTGQEAVVSAEETHLDLSGTDLVIRTPRGRVRARLPLAGRVNVANACAACAAAAAIGLDPEEMSAGLAQVRSVRGRFERIPGPGFDVVIDYAHTPDALENLLRAARELSGGQRRIVVVFGCGGDRDRGKRPLMGEIAARLADVAILTSDNPRREDPEAILDEIARGIPAGAASILRRTARREAIRAALDQACRGDLILIAGKGHETYQIMGTEVLPFDDREEVLRWMDERGARRE